MKITDTNIGKNILEHQKMTHTIKRGTESLSLSQNEYKQ
jgi:hypothetical protein